MNKELNKKRITKLQMEVVHLGVKLENLSSELKDRIAREEAEGMKCDVCGERASQMYEKTIFRVKVPLCLKHQHARYTYY